MYVLVLEQRLVSGICLYHSLPCFPETVCLTEPGPRLKATSPGNPRACPSHSGEVTRLMTVSSWYLMLVLRSSCLYLRCSYSMSHVSGPRITSLHQMSVSTECLLNQRLIWAIGSRGGRGAPLCKCSGHCGCPFPPM